jgi:hypothetical protein
LFPIPAPFIRRSHGEGGKPQRPKETKVPRTCKPRTPTGEPRPKTGGRKKGSLNKWTVAICEAVLSVFADIQAATAWENGHFLNWALGNATYFYKLIAKLLPTQMRVLLCLVIPAKLSGAKCPAPANPAPPPANRAPKPAATGFWLPHDGATTDRAYALSYESALRDGGTR